ncbi:hypothetical protein [Streptomyces fumanus]|uniref:hypothetical protein n=1 Tax=Streptomyces fumanus TaxID=67302 RepID=UPI0033DD4D4E
MKKPSYLWAAGLAVALLGPVPVAAAAPGDVTATECLRGGGLLVIAADGPDGTLTKHCRGGSHDGETVV